MIKFNKQTLNTNILCEKRDTGAIHELSALRKPFKINIYVYTQTSPDIRNETQLVEIYSIYGK